jgi:hypothetical protein
MRLSEVAVTGATSAALRVRHSRTAVHQNLIETHFAEHPTRLRALRGSNYLCKPDCYQMSP